MKLSLCIATFNEEENIHYPLDSAYDLVDEVVIVDGGSTDKTVEKAKAYGKKVRVFIEKNPAMFHINKQKAIERAKGEWILQLDADEALSNELKEEIKNIVGVGLDRPEKRAIQESPLQKRKFFPSPSSKVAYSIPRKNFFLTRFLTKGGQYPDYTIRLYKNGAVRFPCRSIHENVTIDTSIVIPSERSESRDLVKTGQIGYLKSPILHFADPNFSRYLRRWDRYTTLDAQMLVKEGKKPSFISYLFIKPAAWFFSTYFRHLGFVDGISGFIFSLFSSLRFWKIYFKWRKMR